MTLEQYWTTLVKRWRLIVICSLLVGVGAAVGSKLMRPLYQSAAQVQVAVGAGGNIATEASLLASNELVQTEAVLATSDSVLREVASHYKGLTAGQLAAEATSTYKLGTQLFEIDVVDPNPKRAAALANDIERTLARQQLDTTQQSNLLLVQAAQPNPTPVQPNLRLNTLIGFVTGLLLGCLSAALLELLDKRVRAPEALTKLLNWPVLATIWQESSQKEDAFHPTEHERNCESYSILRTGIKFATVNKPLRSLMVTSASPGEGKSMIASNLAICMAKAGKNTLLIDADLHHPTLHEKFSLPADKMGLSNAVLALSMPTAMQVPTQLPFSSTSQFQPVDIPTAPQFSLEPYAHAVDIPNLWVMPSGPLPPHPSELLDSKAMERLFEVLASCDFDMAIFDTPHLLGLSDARILASRVDGVLVVVDVARDQKKALEQVKALLAFSGAYVPGCVVNIQRRNRYTRAFFYYDGYYEIDEQHIGNNHKTENGSSRDSTANVFNLPKM